ncbi:MAG: tetratricopeptide repeat protein [Chitinophagales bacterium]
MAKSGKIILTENGLLTHDALLAYAEGRLSADELAQVESLLQADPFSREALEGMKAAAQPAQMRSAVARINEQLRERTQFKVHKGGGLQIHWANYAYAAAVFGVLIGLGAVLVNYMNTRSQQMAMQAEEQPMLIDTASPQQQPVATIAADTAGLTQSTDSAVAMPTATAEKAPVTATAMVPDAVRDEQAPAPLAKRLSESSSRQKADLAPVSANMAAGTTANEAAEKQAAPAAPTLRGAREMGDMKEVVVEQAAPKNASQQAKELFDAGEFEQASKKYEQILDKDPANAEAAYYGGISNYIKGENKKAEKAFDKLIEKNQYPEGSKWYKANLLIRKGKGEQAKKILQELAQGNSSYRDRAQKKLEELNKTETP